MGTMPDSEYWWNHLSPEQQAFVRDFYEAHKLYDWNITDAYRAAELWHRRAGWPETKVGDC
jgi:hypothetical protein